MTKTLIIIPARMASSRFPGKPLAKFKGIPLVQRVYEQVKKSSVVDHVIIATDDKRIYDFAKEINADCSYSLKKYENGSERCFDVIKENYDSDVKNRLTQIGNTKIELARNTASKSGRLGWMDDNCLSVLVAIYNVCVFVYQEIGEKVSYQAIFTNKFDGCRKERRLWLYNTDNKHFEWLKDVELEYDFVEGGWLQPTVFDGLGVLSDFKALKL